MSKNQFSKQALFGALISALIVIVSALDMIGNKARLVNIVSIVAGSIGAGVALGTIAERYRREKQDRRKDISKV